jgi:3-keto-5-aminohexanoate cleavage enzyme
MTKNIIDKLIINYTPTGMIPKKKMTPYIPISPSEIIEDVHQAWELGITMAHLHARDLATEEGTYKAEIYAEIFSGIRKYAPELIICASLSGRNFPEFEKRAEPLTLTDDLKPDMGSLTLSSLNFTRQASINSPEMVQALAKKMLEVNVLPELEAFDLGMVNYMYYLIKKGLIKPPYYINLLFGNVASAQADPSHIGLMLNDLPDNTYWALAGIGTTQLALNTIAIALGGGVRVGLEDNIYFDLKGTKLATNKDLLERIHGLAKTMQRPIMKSSEMRERLGLQPGNGLYGLKQSMGFVAQ